MHREVSMHESRPEQQRGREQWIVVSGTNTIGHGLHVADRVQGLTGTLLHDVIWWVNSWISVELVLFIVLLMDDVASFIKNTKKS